MSSRHDTPPMERLVRRCLKNGIKTITGRNSGESRIVTYRGDQATFLALLQQDAAQLDPSFDQGQRSAEFAAMVATMATELAA